MKASFLNRNREQSDQLKQKLQRTYETVQPRFERQRHSLGTVQYKQDGESGIQMNKNSSSMKKNIQFLKRMRDKYQGQIDSLERVNPLPFRSNAAMKATADGRNRTKKSSFGFSPATMPLSQQAVSLAKLPRAGKNLLPALAQLPEEQNSQIVNDMSLKQQRTFRSLQAKQVPSAENSARFDGQIEKVYHSPVRNNYQSQALEQILTSLSQRGRQTNLPDDGVSSRFNTNDRFSSQSLERIKRTNAYDDLRENIEISNPYHEKNTAFNYTQRYNKPVLNPPQKSQVSRELQKLNNLPMFFSKSVLADQLSKREAYYGSSQYGIGSTRMPENAYQSNSQRQMQSLDSGSQGYYHQGKQIPQTKYPHSQVQSSRSALSVTGVSTNPVITSNRDLSTSAAILPPPLMRDQQTQNDGNKPESPQQSEKMLPRSLAGGSLVILSYQQNPNINHQPTHYVPHHMRSVTQIQRTYASQLRYNDQKARRKLVKKKKLPNAAIMNSFKGWSQGNESSMNRTPNLQFDDYGNEQSKVKFLIDHQEESNHDFKVQNMNDAQHENQTEYNDIQQATFELEPEPEHNLQSTYNHE